MIVVKDVCLTPLILDLAESVGVVYDKNNEQVCFAGTTIGTPDDIDSAGLD